MSDIKISSIVATARNRVIGKDNELLWHIPADFKHFKATTMGKPMIMGRKTYKSLPAMLKGRDHIIITRNAIDFEDDEFIWYCGSIEDAIEKAKAIAEKDGVDEIFIIGGGQIYAATMPIIDRLYLTLVERDYEGDTRFPEINWDEWTILNEEKIEEETEKDRPSCTIYTLERKTS